MDTNVAFEGKKYRVNGIDMHVVIQGQGPDVLLVHGFPDSIAVWRHQIPALVAAGYRVIAPDQRGFGLTEAPREPGPMLSKTMWPISRRCWTRSESTRYAW